MAGTSGAGDVGVGSLGSALDGLAELRGGDVVSLTWPNQTDLPKFGRVFESCNTLGIYAARRTQDQHKQ